MVKPVFLGKLVLHWCDKCDAPVLDETCACGNATRFVTITPPGDIRPAFPYDVERINQTSIQQFGKKLIADNEIVIYNKAPYDDRMEEIICGGKVIGTIRYEIDKPGWVLLLRLEGARRIFNSNSKAEDPDAEKTLKNWMMVFEKAIPFVADGSSVLVPGIMRMADGIEKENEVVAITPDFEVVAVGRAKMKSEEIRAADRGKAVKTRWAEMPSEKIEKGAASASAIESAAVSVTESAAESAVVSAAAEKSSASADVRSIWKKAIDANRHIIDKFESDSVTFIRNAAGNMNKKLTCSYSGGKDSLVTLHLVSKAFGPESGNEQEYEIVFADTGLEFQETLDNVSEVVKIYGKTLRETSAGDAFWEGFKTHGPPSVDNRWCTQSCKLMPITMVIESNYADSGGCLTFIGQRQYESKARAKSQRIWKSPSVRGQIGAAPIQEWTAMHVWLYIFDKDLHYNPLYGKGFDRIGCWLCPAASLADFDNLRITHPDSMKMWDEKLIEAGQEKGISDPAAWVKFGLWRYDRLPPAMKKLADDKGIKYSKWPGVSRTES
jgi:3''-phosphoadenosine 5''-phosphosulfate sulfotransferase (PAPS reductase)/FAD synthetase and related enzymes